MPELSFFTAGLALLLIAAGLTPLRQLGPRKPMRVQGAALIYLAVPGSLLVLLRDLDGGRDWLLLTIFASFAVDTGAYAVGRAIGRHKLAPKISPKKTIEGAAGGYLLGAAAVVALVTLLDIDAGAVAVAAMALLLPPVAMAGDLLESWLKRRMGVKDASGLLPGHGGFMDRLDSVLPVGVLVYTVAQLA
jgi:phosphatidate cytidylyltransferase